MHLSVTDGSGCPLWGRHIYPHPPKDRGFGGEEKDPEDLGEALMRSWEFSHVEEFGLSEVGSRVQK